MFPLYWHCTVVSQSACTSVMLCIAAKTMHLTAKVYELEPSYAHFQPLYTHSFVSISAILPSPIVHLSAMLHIVVKAITATTMTTSIIMLARHWKEPQMAASTMVVGAAVQMTTIITTMSWVTMAELMMTVTTDSHSDSSDHNDNNGCMYYRKQQCHQKQLDQLQQLCHQWMILETTKTNGRRQCQRQRLQRWWQWWWWRRNSHPKWPSTYCLQYTTSLLAGSGSFFHPCSLL